MISGALALRCALKGPTALPWLPLSHSDHSTVRFRDGDCSAEVDWAKHLHHGPSASASQLKERGFSDVGLLVVAGLLCGFASLGAIAKHD